MRKYFILILGCSLLLSACNTKKQAASLPEAFLESLAKQKFELLESYLPNAAFYKSLGKDAPSRTDEEIAKFIESSNSRLKEGWTTISEKIKSGNIDASKVTLKETLVYSPFKADKMKSMVVDYDYNNNTWDDISFIVSEWNGKFYLLEIPNVQRFFSMEDKSLSASSEAKLSLEMSKPEFKKSVQEQVEKIINYAKEKKLKEFTEMLVYRGEDENRKWKSVMSLNNAAETEQVTEFMGRVNHYLEDCGSYTFDELKSERESEGVWIVMPVKCINKIIHFAFLKIDNKLLLGDIDSETRE